MLAIKQITMLQRHNYETISTWFRKIYGNRQRFPVIPNIKKSIPNNKKKLAVSKWVLFRITLVATGVLLAAGCTNYTTHYHWGNYDNVVLKGFLDQDNMTAARQISLLEQDIEKAQVKNMPVAPGVFAHLGMAYALLGEKAKSELAFEEEVRRFPEAKIMIEGMLSRSKKSKKN
jgi:hypothetical protein